MSYHTAAMVERQARLISEQQDTIRDLKKKRNELIAQNQRVNAAGCFYIAMQRAIVDSPFLQSEWDRFLAFLKMNTSEEELHELIKQVREENPEHYLAGAIFR